MQKLIFSLLLSIVVIATFGQNQETTFCLNGGCEIIENGKPIGWNASINPKFVTKLDSTVSKNGKYSLSISCDTNILDYSAWSFIIPNNYKGKEITLTGYIKTENVAGDGAGIWMHIMPNVAYDYMNKRCIKGTTNWTKFEITLKMDPTKTKSFYFGGILMGKGKVWFDDFQITIDGKDIEFIKPIAKLPAENDVEFNKGSKVNNFALDKSKIENLKQLGLIWGFLKYYHPNIAKGNFNWDYELFRVLPKVLNVSNNTERDAIFFTWIQKLGEFKVGKEKKINPKDVKLYPDLDWIKNSNFSQELTILLLKVKNAKRTNSNYYVKLTKGVGNPIFDNESPYYSMTYPDAGYRLLALYRYWNIIQYYFPYKNLIQEDWKNVLEEFIPKFVNAKDQSEYSLTALEVITRIHDTHAKMDWNEMIEKHFGLRYSAIDLKFIEGKAIVVGFLDTLLEKETNLKIGDIIISINKKSVEEFIKENLKYTPASNYPTKLRDIAPTLLRSNDSTISIEYQHSGKIRFTSIKTYPNTIMNPYKKHQTPDTCFKWINEEIAYIHNGYLKREYLPKLYSEFRSAKGLIIDDRNYPSDFPMYELSNYLLSKKQPFVKMSRGNITEPGFFKYFITLSAGKKNKNLYKGKVVILINEETQSSAEFHAMAYRTIPNATIIGSVTAGADGNISELYFPGGICTWISALGIYYPDGQETQRIGIVPDVVITPTIEGIKSGRDEVLEKAIEIINGK